MKISFRFKYKRTIIAFSGVVLIGVLLATLFNMSSVLPVVDAEKRVRVYLTRAMSQRLIKVNAEHPASAEKDALLAELAEELKRINAIEITSIEVRKLIPDIFIRPHRPTFIVRVEMRTSTERFSPRYFWLPWTGIDNETGELAWYFSL